MTPICISAVVNQKIIKGSLPVLHKQNSCASNVFFVMKLK